MYYSVIMGFPGGASGKESACYCRRHTRCGFDSWDGKIPWRRKWQPTPQLLPGKFHGQRSLEGYSPWGHKELDMTEHVCMHTHSVINYGDKIKHLTIINSLRYHPNRFPQNVNCETREKIKRQNISQLLLGCLILVTCLFGFF